MRSLALPLLLLLPACPLAAQESADPSTRLHDAYVLEVVEGKVPEAARLYLALLEETDLDPTVRAQAELRFAACCVVLGRADEARARLAALATRDDLPAGLRAEVDEYRRGLEGVGAGTALDAKLEQMVFDLGRSRYELVTAGMQPEPEVYRDFAILGERGWPTLRKLLDHPDGSLQSQAFLLLCRMDAPGMVEAWRPETMAAYVATEFVQWLKRHRDDVPALEARLRELPAPTLEHWAASDLASVGFSPAFIAELVKRELDPQTVVNAAYWAGADGASLIRSWIGDSPLGVRACCTALAMAARESRDGWTADEERELVRQAAGLLARARPRGTYGSFLNAIGKRYDAGVALDAMKSVLDYWASAEFRDSQAGEAGAQEFLNDLLQGLAGALAGRELDAGEAALLRDRIDQWIVLSPQLGGVVPELVKEVLRRLDDDTGVAWLTSLFERGDARAQSRLVGAFEPRDPRTPRRVAAVLRVCDPNVATRVLQWIGKGPTADDLTLTPEFAAAMRDVLPGILLEDRGQGGSIMWMLPQVLRPVGPEEARVRYLQWVRALAEAPKGAESDLQNLVFLWVGGRGSGLEESYRWMWEEVVLPVVPDLFATLRADLSQRLLQTSVVWLGTQEGGKEARTLLARDVMEHFTLMGWTLAGSMLRLPDLFPYEKWVPELDNVRPNSFARLMVPREGLTALASWLDAHPEGVDVSLLYLLRQWLPADEMRGLLSSLYAKCGPEKLAALLAVSDRATLDPHVAEGTLVRFGAVADVDAAALGQLALLVAELRASDKLIPVARRLLGEEDAAAISNGIALARKLARPELIEPLVGILDSPDANLRTAAKDAIESIREWQAFRSDMAGTPR